MELRRRRLVAVAALALALVPAGVARADDVRLPPSQTRPPPYHRLTADEAVAIAGRAPRVRAELRRTPSLRPTAYLKGTSRWQVSYFEGRRERVQVLIDDASAGVREVWTGAQVAWTMARGYPGAFAGHAAALYVWLPLCLLFVAPFVDLRRPRRLIHLDLLAIVSLSVSLAFFNHAKIGVSVPLVYPPLVYLAVRLALAGLRPRPSGARLIPSGRAGWLGYALVFLVCFRVALNLADSSVIDVGYASLIGADRIVHGHTLYGAFPANVGRGDTYGPFTYIAYVPFRALLGFDGRWDRLPAAHAAAITFDLLTIAGLFALGRRRRPGRAGVELGTALAFAWAACPFTLYTLDSNPNDALVALLLVGALLAFGRPAARGALVALAGAAKLAPLVVWPLFATAGPGDRRRTLALSTAGLAAVVAVTVVPLLPHGSLATLYERTLGYQAGRDAPFSIWGQVPSLHWLLVALEIAVVIGALAAAVAPIKRDLRACAALAAALLIGVELCATYWFYLYLVWFLAPALVAIFDGHATGAVERRPTPPARAAEPALA